MISLGILNRKLPIQFFIVLIQKFVYRSVLVKEIIIPLFVFALIRNGKENRIEINKKDLLGNKILLFASSFTENGKMNQCILVFQYGF